MEKSRRNVYKIFVRVRAMKKSVFCLVTIIGILFLTSGCSKIYSGATNQVVSDPVHENILCDSAWLVYWDLENGIEEINDMASLENIIYFSTWYNQEDEIVVPNELLTAKAELKNDNQMEYLSFTNDIVYDDGSSSQKNIEIIKNLFSDQNMMDLEAEEIIKIAINSDFDGIEMDFENLKKDTELWNEYIQFLEILKSKCLEKNLLLRVILEPATPTSQLSFPDGIEYVMMCYNLYGGFSEPGPKADFEFLDTMKQSISNLPGKNGLALATGGFDWNTNGVKSMTVKQVSEIIENYNIEVRIDENSGAKNFNYTDDAGIEHEIWYSDFETINQWIEKVNEAEDISTSLWRLGGNTLNN